MPKLLVKPPSEFTQLSGADVATLRARFFDR
jgi:hypothetical protein